MNKKGDAAELLLNVLIGFFILVVGSIVLFVVGAIVIAPFHIPYVTSTGMHSVQVTAVEDTGLFFKTTTVYVKTDLASTQEETYCLDKHGPNYMQLKEQLVSASVHRQKVVIVYADVLSKGITHCNGEMAIITGVSQ